MSQKKNDGILLPTEIRVVGSYTDRLLSRKLLSTLGYGEGWVLNIPSQAKRFASSGLEKDSQ